MVDTIPTTKITAAALSHVRVAESKVESAAWSTEDRREVQRHLSAASELLSLIVPPAEAAFAAFTSAMTGDVVIEPQPTGELRYEASMPADII